jgi:hypothetical protein
LVSESHILWFILKASGAVVLKPDHDHEFFDAIVIVAASDFATAPFSIEVIFLTLTLTVKAIVIGVVLFIEFDNCVDDIIVKRLRNVFCEK